MLRLLLCVLAASLVGVSSLTIIASQEQLYEINGVVRTQSTLSAVCGPSDMGVVNSLTIQSDSGETHSVDIECQLPVRVYTIEKYGVIPSDGSIVTSKVCSVADVTIAQQPNTTSTTTLPPDPAGRVLLDIDTAPVGNANNDVASCPPGAAAGDPSCNPLIVATTCPTPADCPAQHYPASAYITASCISVLVRKTPRRISFLPARVLASDAEMCACRPLPGRLR
jgi:hypothetical protein